MPQIPAGRAIVEALLAEGIDHVFGLVGTTTNSIITELYGRDDITFIDTRHEEGAAFMAYGYSRASGKPAACVTTSGPGTINLATGISLAYKGRAPVIAIAGNTAQEYTYRDGAQEFDLVNTFKPITQLALQVNQADRIPEMLHYAFRTALYGKRGPVLIDIPRDLIDDRTIDWDVQSPATYRPVADRTAGDAQAVQQAAALLARAQRPLLLAGGGIIDSEATADAVTLAEWLDMAVVPSYGHNDAFPNSHRLYVGPPGGRGASEALQAMNRADVILALGTRINQGSTGWDYSVINPNTQIIQVDIDPFEIGRNYPLAVGIVGDAGAVAHQLFEALSHHSPEEFPEGRANPEWTAEIADLQQRRRARLDAESQLAGDPMMPQRVFSELNKVSAPGLHGHHRRRHRPRPLLRPHQLRTAPHHVQLRRPGRPRHGPGRRPRHQVGPPRPARPSACKATAASSTPARNSTPPSAKTSPWSPSSSTTAATAPKRPSSSASTTKSTSALTWKTPASTVWPRSMAPRATTRRVPKTSPPPSRKPSPSSGPSVIEVPVAEYFPPSASLPRS